MRKLIRSSRVLLALFLIVGAVSCDRRHTRAAKAEPSQVTISVDTKGQCYYSSADMVNPKAIACEKLKKCIDDHIDPASDACPYM